MSKMINNLPKITDLVLGQGHGVKGLVDLGLESVPDQYILPPEERLQCKADLVDTIPIIDFTNLDDPNVEESMFNAAREWGSFQIVNHGIPREVLEDLKSAIHSFFQLPVEDKKKHLKENSDNNIVKLATSFRTHTEAVMEWRDYLNLRYTSEEEINAYWPPACKDQAVEYIKRSEVVIRRLVEVLLKKINVKDIDKTVREGELMAGINLGFNYYPHCPNPNMTHGVGPHCDVSYITIVLQDETGGLYVRKNNEGQDDGWIHVPPIEGALLVNIGDALQIVSNDKYKSIEHRVVANKEKSRISIAFFLDPKDDAIVGPWPEVLETYGEQPKYKPVVFSDYYQHFMSKANDGTETIDFAKI